MLITKVCTQKTGFTHKRCSPQLSGWGNKDKMAEAPLRLCPSGSWDKDGSYSHRQLSCPRSQDNKSNDRQKPLKPRSSTSCRAASSDGLHSCFWHQPLHSQLGSFQLGLDSAGPGLTFLLSSTLLLTPVLLSITVPWNCVSGEWVGVGQP